MVRRWRGLAALVVLAAVLAGCGGSDEEAAAALATLAESDGGAAADDPSSAATASEVSAEDAALEFAQCMRNNGVEEFTDPAFGADGNVEFGGPGGGGDGGDGAPAFVEDPDFEAAAEACQDTLGAGGFAPDEAQQAELQDSLVAFTECLREQGLDVDDPQFGTGDGALGPGGPGAGGGGGPFGDQIDIDDPDQAAALELCQEQVGLQPPGDN